MNYNLKTPIKQRQCSKPSLTLSVSLFFSKPSLFSLKVKNQIEIKTPYDRKDPKAKDNRSIIKLPSITQGKTKDFTSFRQTSLHACSEQRYMYNKLVAATVVVEEQHGNEQVSLRGSPCESKNTSTMGFVTK